jgi:GAF domain-containing protein
MRARETDCGPAELADRTVARILAETAAEEQLYAQVLEAMGQALGWDLGAIWEASEDGDALVCADVWCAPSAGAGAAEFARITKQTSMRRSQGLPGRVLATGEPHWVVDFALEEDFPRARSASATGMRSALCSPIRSAGGILGAIEFFSSRVREPDDDLL